METYLTQFLAPRLQDGYGLSGPQVDLLVSDVRSRLASILRCWSDRAFRQTILVTGVEEATFYQPASAPLETRALVVLAVRNSLVGDLNAQQPAIPGFQHAIPDSEMPAVTGEAVHYFGRVDLNATSQRLPPLPHDAFGEFPGRFPTAWRALSHLAQLRGKDLEASFEPLDAPPPGLALPTELASSPFELNPVVMSGMSPEIDLVLGQALLALRRGITDLFFADCFKFVTRNPHKLYRVLEFVLCHGAAFVTHNYYLANGYVARRRRLLRPAHTVSDMMAKLEARKRGTTQRHRKVLEDVARQVVQEQKGRKGIATTRPSTGKRGRGMVIVYGSLYLDRAESFEYAEMQVDDCIAKARKLRSQIVLAFDIVATPAQIAVGEAHETARLILEYVDANYPGLNNRCVGITDDDERRPMRDTLLSRRLSPDDIDDVHLFVVE
jgi:hypothetical protein